MSQVERIREVPRNPLDQKYWNQKAEDGWQLVAVEWEREAGGAERESARRLEEVPYGFKVSTDCFHLEENSLEMEALAFLMELIVQDISLPRMAEELNRRGFRTRQGKEWGAVSIFKILPRLIEAGPRIFSNEDWAARRKELSPIVWNS